MNLLKLGSNGLKSIPLNALPPEAWTNVTGGENATDSRVLSLYETTPWLHRGVNVRVNALTGMPLSLHTEDENGDELERGEWPIDLDIASLAGALYKDYILYARAYTFVNVNAFDKPATADGMPLGIMRLLPSSIKPIEDEIGQITGWKRMRKGEEKDYPLERIAHWYKPPVRTENGYDVSDAMVALAAAGVLRNSDLMSESFFKNGGVNTTLIWDETQSMTDSDKQKVQTWFEKSVSSLKNAFKYRVVGGKFGSLTLGYPLKDLSVPELTNSKRQDIATALGIPQSILFSDAANFATAQQDDLHLYDKTVIPDSITLEAILNEYIFHPLGVHLKYHPERMEIYQKIETDKAQSLNTLVTGKIWTVQEARVATKKPKEPAPDDPQYDEFTKAPEQKQQEAIQMAQQTAPTPPTDTTNADNPPPDNAVTKALKQWQTKALNRWNEGHLSKALAFDSEDIPKTLKNAIVGGLEACKSKDAIRTVFNDALLWAEYP